MRYALSAAAAASGLLLFGLATLGEPADYVRDVRTAWNGFAGGDPAVPAPVPAPEAVHDPVPVDPARLEALETEVKRLKAELALRAAAAAAAQAAAPTAQVAAASVQAAPAPPSAAPPPMLVQAAPSPPLPAVPVPDRREPVAVKPPATPPKPLPAKTDDDIRAVLTRLRQAEPERTARAEPAPRPAPPPSTPAASQPAPPSPAAIAPSPVLPALFAARSALSDGRIADSRRWLQQAQLALVFRPVDPQAEGAAAAAAGSADIASALEALGNSDPRAGRAYIGRAIDAMSGSVPVETERAPAARGDGYAPAYPSPSRSDAAAPSRSQYTYK